MGGLARKVLAPLVVAGILTMPWRVSAQQNTISEFVPLTSVSVGGGIYKDNDQTISDYYGSILGLNGRIAKDFNRNIRGELGIDLFSKENKDAILGRDLSLVSFTATGEYVSPFKNQRGATYFKAGVLFTQARENVGSRSESGQGFGIVLGSGIEIKISPDSEIYGEILYKSVSAETLDLAGEEISIGYKKFLGR